MPEPTPEQTVAAQRLAVWAQERQREARLRAAIVAIADRLASPNEDRIFVAKEYTKGDLRRDLLEAAHK